MAGVPIIVQKKRRDARMFQQRLLSGIKTVAVKHNSGRMGTAKEFFNCAAKASSFPQNIDLETLVLNARHKPSRVFSNRECDGSARSFPSLAECQTSHDVTGTDLDSALREDRECSRLFQSRSPTDYPRTRNTG